MEVETNLRESWQADEEASPTKSISKPQRARLRIMDSDSENEAKSSQEVNSSASQCEHENAPVELSQIGFCVKDGDSKSISENNYSEKVRRILDSSDDDGGSISSDQGSRKNARDSSKTLEDSSTDSSLSQGSTASRRSYSKRGKKLRQKPRMILDSSDDDLDDTLSASLKSTKSVTTETPVRGKETELPTNTDSFWKSMLKGDFYSYGGSSEDEGNTHGKLEECYSAGETSSKTKAVSRRQKSNITSKKKMEEEARLVHSETQRMTREAIVSLPYHKPKQRPLTDFLNRKRTVLAQDIKPKSNELEHITNSFLEREKEAEQLFKSDSEDSDREAEKSSEPQQNPDSTPVDNPPPNLSPESTATSNDPSTPPSSCDTPAEDKPLDTAVGATSSGSIPFVNEVSTLELSHVQESETPVLVNSETFDLKLEEEEEPAAPAKPAFATKMAQIATPSTGKLRLQGKPGELITFESSAKKADPSHLNELVSRFMKHAARKSSSPEKKDIKLNIVKKVVDSSGKEQLQSEVVLLKAKPAVEKKPGVELPPGAMMKLLKDSLKSAISAKRQAERQKKLQTQAEDDENLVDEGMDAQAEEDEFDDEEILSDEPDTEDEEADGCREGALDGVKETDKPGYQSDAVEGDIDETDDQPEEDNEDENDQSFANTTVDKLNLSSSPNLDRSLPENHKKLAAEPETNTQDNMDELVGLCTANFETQKEVSRSLFGKESHNTGLGKSFSRIVEIEDDDDPVESQANNTEEVWSTLVAADDDPGPGKHSSLLDDEENGGIIVRKKKRKTRLCFSDDEEEEKEVAQRDEPDEADEEDEAAEEDENEELVEFRKATEYFEDEAELSGSDVGSGDEKDDANDYWEREEGDDETFDEEELRKQVERAHLKTLLDQDQRDVRLMQELFLEDGDLHSEGGGRLRQFRWRSTQLEESEENPVTKSDGEDEGEAAENEDEAAWRKQRHEREKWLSEQQSNLEIVTVIEKKKVTWVSSTKVSTVSTARQAETVATRSALPDSPQKVHTSLNGKRGSFLRRAEKDLMVIANLAKSSLPIQGAANANNFVFASVTPERAVKVKEAKKRPMDPTGPAAKKPKANDKTSIFSFL